MSVFRQLDIAILGVHFFTSPARRILSERRDDLPEIIVVMQGIYQAQYRQGKQTLSMIAQSGDVVVWPARAWRLETSDANQPLHCIAIYLRGAIRDDLPRMLHDHGGLIRILAHRLMDLKGDNLGEEAIQEISLGYTNAILSEYIRLAYLQKDNLPMKVARFIEEHVSESITLPVLAKAIGLEKHHFDRRYRKLTGRTPMDEVRRRKVAHARGMLLTIPTRSLKEVCSSVGITNPKRLIHLINRYSGTRVRDLRRKAARALSKLAAAGRDMSPKGTQRGQPPPP